MSSRNRRILEGLLRAAAENHLHHAYILSGPASAAKVAAVETFAAEIFAQAGGGLFGAGADASQIRERIAKRAHPDFTRLEEPPEGEKNAVTLLEQIRDLPRTLSYPPLEAPKRVILIPDATALRVESWNSILKILEEPPAHTMFFLLCRDAGELLQTIVSRCQTLRFAPLPDAELVELLGDRMPADRADLLAWSEGAPERAELLLGTEGALELRKQACDRLLELWEASPRIPSSAAQWVEKVEDDEPTAVVLDSWEVLLRDLAFVASGAGPADIRFQECHGRLRAIAVRGGEAMREDIPRRYSAINRFRVYRRLNGNLRLDFAALLTELQIKAPTQP